MSDSSFTVDEFQSVAATHLSFLEAHGFARDPFLEERKSTYGTVVYRGKHLAFVFSCDVRDQSIDASVVKVENGQLRGGDAGGYSSDLFMHLVNKEGYRGGVGIEDSSEGSCPEKMLAGWATLLRTKGQLLLADEPDSV